MELNELRAKAQLQAEEVEAAKQEPDAILEESKRLADRLKDLEGHLAEVENNTQTHGHSHVDDYEELADSRLYQLEELEKEMELAVLRARESVRCKLEQQYQQEIATCDELLKVLRARRSRSGRQWDTEDTGEQSTVSGDSSVTTSGLPKEDQVDPTTEVGGTHRKLTLSPFEKFSGDEKEAGAFEHWTRKLLHHAELEKWSERVQLLQLELHLTGMAELSSCTKCYQKRAGLPSLEPLKCWGSNYSQCRARH